MRFRPSRAALILCTVSTQACTTFVATTRPPGEVLADSPHSVRVTLNDGKTLELSRPVVRNGFVVEVGRDSASLSAVKQIEVPKVERGRTIALVAVLVGLSVILSMSAGSTQESDEGPSTIVPVAIRWP